MASFYNTESGDPSDGVLDGFYGPGSSSYNSLVIQWRGPWDPLATYKDQDAVSREENGVTSSYISLIDSNTNLDPLNSPQAWDLMAEGGSGGGSGGGIEEAPVDGKQYGRQNANWTEVTGGTGGGITGPSTTTVGYLATWSNTTGSALGVGINPDTKANLNSPIFTGYPETPDIPDNTGGNFIANVDYVNNRSSEAVTGGLLLHTQAADPHSQYATDADLSAHTSASNPHSQYALLSGAEFQNHLRVSEDPVINDDVVNLNYLNTQLSKGALRGVDYLWGGSTGNPASGQVIVENPGGTDRIIELSTTDADGNARTGVFLLPGDNLVLSTSPTAFARYMVTALATNYGTYWSVPCVRTDTQGTQTPPAIGAPVTLTGVLSGGSSQGTGDVVGPDTATDNGIALYDGTSGQLIKNGPLITSKADVTYVNSQDSLKADKTYVDSQDALKADKSYVDIQDSLKAPLSSPAFTGIPVAPTPDSSDSSTKIATTAYVKSVVAGAGGGDVSGPASSTDNYIPQWNGTSGKLLKGGISTSTFATSADLALKADKTYVDSQDVLKADKSYVDSQDALKADKSYVDSQDALKASLSGATFTGNLRGLDPIVPEDMVTKDYLENTLDASASRALNYLWGGTTGNPTTGHVVVQTTAGTDRLIRISTTDADGKARSGVALLPGDNVVISTSNTSFARYMVTALATDYISYWEIPCTRTDESGVQTPPPLDTPVVVTGVLSGGSGAGIGYVVGPDTSVDLSIALFNGTSGEYLIGGPLITTSSTDVGANRVLKVGAQKVQLGADVAGTVSPVFTGTPTAPTATAGTNTTQLATTAFVNAEITADRPYSNANPLMDGVANQGVSAYISRQDHVHPSDTTKVGSVSPALTGTPTAPTAAVGTSTTQIATTAFVNAEIAEDRPYSISNPLMDGNASQGVSPNLSRQDHVHPSDTSRAPLASPTFTGTPKAPTFPINTGGDGLATMAYTNAQSNDAATFYVGEHNVDSAAHSALFAAKASLASPTFTGVPAAPTAAVGTSTTQIATTAFVNLNTPSKNQLCSAWVNFNGTGTAAIRDSYNVSSVTDNSVGNYTINFTNTLTNSDYAVINGLTNEAASSGVALWRIQTGGKLTSSVQVVSMNASAGAIDVNQGSIAIFGGNT